MTDARTIAHEHIRPALCYCGNEYDHSVVCDALTAAIQAALDAKDREIAEMKERPQPAPSGCACEVDEVGGKVLRWCALHNGVKLRAEAAEARVKELESGKD